MRKEVLARLGNQRKCATPEMHKEYQEPQKFGALLVSESLDPNDVFHYEVCGLCGGMLTEIPEGK